MVRVVSQSIVCMTLVLCIAMAWVWFSTQNQWKPVLSWGMRPYSCLDIEVGAGAVWLFYYLPLGSAIIPSWSGTGELSFGFWWLIPVLAFWPSQYAARRVIGNNFQFLRRNRSTADEPKLTERRMVHLEYAATNIPSAIEATDRGRMSRFRRTINLISILLLGAATLVWVASLCLGPAPSYPFGAGWHLFAGEATHESQAFTSVQPVHMSQAYINSLVHYDFIAPKLLVISNIQLRNVGGEPPMIRVTHLREIEFCCCGFWWAIAGVVLLSADRSFLRPWRLRTYLCRKCGRNPRATPDRCPECGTAVADKPQTKPAV
jgi:hypothetical protein